MTKLGKTKLLIYLVHRWIPYQFVIINTYILILHLENINLHESAELIKTPKSRPQCSFVIQISPSFVIREKSFVVSSAKFEMQIRNKIIGHENYKKQATILSERIGKLT